MNPIVYPTRNSFKSPPGMSKSWANKPLPPTPDEDLALPGQFPGDSYASKLTTSGSSGESFIQRLKRVASLNSRRSQSRPRRQKSQTTQVRKPEMVDKGTQTENHYPSRRRENRKSARTPSSQATQRRTNVSRSQRPDNLSSLPSFLQPSPYPSDSDSPVGASGHSTGRDRKSDQPVSTSGTGLEEYPMVHPNSAKNMSHFNQSKVNSLGTYESRYSDYTNAGKDRSPMGRRETMRRANSDTSLALPANSSSTVLNSNTALIKEGSRERPTKGMRSRGISEEGTSPKGRLGGRSNLKKNPSTDSTSSPLRNEIRSSPTPSPDGIFPGGKMPAVMAPMAPPRIHKEPAEGYFDLPEPPKTDVVPDHLHGSPLCPLSPKYHKGQQLQCPLHGRASWPTDASSESNDMERFSEDGRNISDDLDFHRNGFFGPDHVRGSPLCPAFNKALGPGNKCLWHGKKTVVRDQAEDPVE